LPEVSLVAILDADKEGFLRSTTSLIQTIGRAARHVNGKAIMYADHITDSMRRAIDETNRRRAKQVAYNTEHNIQPQSIYKAIRDLTDRVRVEEEQGEYAGESRSNRRAGRGQSQPQVPALPRLSSIPKAEAQNVIAALEVQMKEAAKNLEFEKAAMLRDQVMELRQHALGVDANAPIWEKMRKMGDDVASDDLPTTKGSVQYKPKKGREKSRR